MKEAIITDQDGLYVEPTLVDDSVTGVFPIYETIQMLDADSEPTEVLVGYTVAIAVPSGLYKPKFDIEAETWGEGLTPEEIDEITNVPPVVTDTQRIMALEAQVEALQSENVDLMLALTEADERAQANNVDAMLAIVEADEKAAQNNMDVMLAIAELSVAVEELAAVVTPTAQASE